MTKSLNHITQDLVLLNNDLELSQGEIDERLELELKTLETELVEKTDKYGYRIEKLDFMAQYWRAKAQEAADVARSIENHIEKMKTRIKSTMTVLDRKHVVGDVFRFSVRVTPKPKLIIDNKLLSDNYKITEITKIPNKDLIREHLEKGFTVEGCILEQGLTLTIKPNKGE